MGTFLPVLSLLLLPLLQAVQKHHSWLNGGEPWRRVCVADPHHCEACLQH
jgi:hypothetical protein